MKKCERSTNYMAHDLLIKTGIKSIKTSNT